MIHGYWSILDLYKAIFDVMRVHEERRIDFEYLPSRLVVAMKVRTGYSESEIREHWYRVIDRVLPRCLYTFAMDTYVSNELNYDTISFVVTGMMKKIVFSPRFFLDE